MKVIFIYAILLLSLFGCSTSNEKVADSDEKLKLKPKVEIKNDIGRSPDWRDMLLMRSWFDYNEYDIPDNLERVLGLIS